MKIPPHQALLREWPRGISLSFGLAVISLILRCDFADAQWKLVFKSQGGGGMDGPNLPYIFFPDSLGPEGVGFASTPIGLVKTYDDGWNWQRTNDNGWTGITFKDHNTGWLAGDPAEKTTDGGKTWSPQPFAASILYYDHESGALLAEGSVSWDDGITWKNLYSNTQGQFSFINGDTGIVVTNGRSQDPAEEFPWYRTTDGGHSWVVMPVDTPACQLLGIWGTKTYFGISIFGEVMRSDDAGTTWRVISTLPPMRIWPLAPYAPWCKGVVIGDTNQLFVATVDGCFSSKDQGLNWKYMCGVPYPPGYFELDCVSTFCVHGRTIFIHTDDDDSTYIWRLNLDSMQYFNSRVSTAFANSKKEVTVNPGKDVTVYFSGQSDSTAIVLDTINYLIYYGLSDTNNVGVDTAHLSIYFDGALSIKNIQPPNGWAILKQTNSGNALDLWLTSNALPLPANLLAITFGTALDSLSAKIYLDSVHFYGKRLNCDCAALSIAGPDSVEVDFTGCGDSTLLKFMATGSPLSIESIRPNPASGEISVRLSLPQPLPQAGGELVFELTDLMGREITLPQPAPWVLPPQAGGEYGINAGGEYELDVSSLSSGMYLLRASGGGMSASRELVIQK